MYVGGPLFMYARDPEAVHFFLSLDNILKQIASFSSEYCTTVWCYVTDTIEAALLHKQT